MKEDKLLVSLVTNHSFPKWANISEEFNMEVQKLAEGSHVHRTNKQCRER
jgi:hypothetical protein